MTGARATGRHCATGTHHTDGSLDRLLQELLGRVPGTRAAVLLSADGLPAASHGAGRDLTDQVAAGASGIYSIARALGTHIGDSRGVRQVVVALGETTLVLSRVATGARLALVADRNTDPKALAHAMAALGSE